VLGETRHHGQEHLAGPADTDGLGEHRQHRTGVAQSAAQLRRLQQASRPISDRRGEEVDWQQALDDRGVRRSRGRSRRPRPANEAVVARSAEQVVITFSVMVVSSLAELIGGKDGLLITDGT
jgi:hypothetical protein